VPGEEEKEERFYRVKEEIEEPLTYSLRGKGST